MNSNIEGINLDTVQATMSELQKDPELGQCVFRTTNRWTKGTHNVSRFHGFHAVKQEMEHPEPYEMRADEPPILSGGDSAPTPVEYLLGALAACVTNSVVLHAAMKGITIEDLSSNVRGHVDLNGFSGLAPEVPRGYQRIEIDLRARSDADVDQLRELAHFSPTLNTINQSTRVALNIQTEPLST